MVSEIYELYNIIKTVPNRILGFFLKPAYPNKRHP